MNIGASILKQKSQNLRPCKFEAMENALNTIVLQLLERQCRGQRSTLVCDGRVWLSHRTQ